MKKACFTEPRRKVTLRSPQVHFMVIKLAIGCCRIIIINNNKMFLYSAVPVRGSAQCASLAKSVLKVLKSGKECLKVICVYKEMGLQVFV